MSEHREIVTALTDYLEKNRQALNNEGPGQNITEVTRIMDDPTTLRTAYDAATNCNTRSYTKDMLDRIVSVQRCIKSRKKTRLEYVADDILRTMNMQSKLTEKLDSLENHLMGRQ